MHPYVLLRDQLPKSKGKKSQAFSFWIFTPGIALESWKILSGNFLFLELKNPGKFCPGRKLSWNFLKIIYIFPGIYSSGIFHSWNFPLLEFCPGTFCSWNLISRNFLVTVLVNMPNLNQGVIQDRLKLLLKDQGGLVDMSSYHRCNNDIIMLWSVQKNLKHAC